MLGSRSSQHCQAPETKEATRDLFNLGEPASICFFRSATVAEIVCAFTTPHIDAMASTKTKTKICSATSLWLLHFNDLRNEIDGAKKYSPPRIVTRPEKSSSSRPSLKVLPYLTGHFWPEGPWG